MDVNKIQNEIVPKLKIQLAGEILSVQIRGRSEK
jgi:hypothetical protein